MPSQIVIGSPIMLPIEPILECKTPEEVFTHLIGTNADIQTIFDVLIRANTELSMFVLIKIYCTNQTHWGEVEIRGWKKYSKLLDKYDKFASLQSRLLPAKQTKKMFKKLHAINVETVLYSDFVKSFQYAYNCYLTQKRYQKLLQAEMQEYAKNRNNKALIQFYREKNKKTSINPGMANDDYEFGLSDW